MREIRSSERHSRIETLFQRALDLPEDHRNLFLTQECGADRDLRDEVDKLLEHYSSAGVDFLTRTPFEFTQPRAPQRVGRYEIIRLIGQGGMGSVFEARQEHPNRSVAVKLLRHWLRTPESVRRFELEAEILGSLDHPGVAHIYEAGIAEVTYATGVVEREPFLAMELVRGETLVRYAQSQDLDLRSRVQLLARICDSVHHAHQKGVIHRDLKPANIIVTDEGQPKILDFGVARAAGVDVKETLTANTSAGQLLGTLVYMSPEQLTANPRNVDTRSDIYALGVVAYELLCRRAPIDVAGMPMTQAMRRLTESEPPRAGAICAELTGDIEAILAKALEKAPEERYSSAAEFAADLRRFLKHEPVLARPYSVWNQAWKFARRNIVLVGGITATLTALIIGSAGVSFFAWRAVQQAQLTQIEARRAQAVVNFLRETLTSANPSTLRGQDITVRQALDEAAARLDSGKLANEPEIEAALRSTIGETYLSLGCYPEARLHLERAMALLRAKPDFAGDALVTTMSDLAVALSELQEYDQVNRLNEEALALAIQLHGPEHELVARVLTDQGSCLAAQGNLDAAEKTHRRALEIRRSLSDAAPANIAASLNNLGFVLQSSGRLADAVSPLKEALEIRRQYLPPNHPDLAGILNNLGTLLHRLGSLDEAESMLREALKIRRESQDPSHPDIAVSLNNLAMLLSNRGNAEEATSLLREAIGIQRARFGEEHTNVALARLNLAQLLQKQGLHDEADSEARHALETLRKTIGAGSPQFAMALHNVAAIVGDRGRVAEAEPLLREALEIIDARLGSDTDIAAHMRDTLGVTLLALEKNQEAVALLSKALLVRRRVLGDEHEKTLLSWCNVAMARLRAGDAAGAESEASALIPILRTNGQMNVQLGSVLLTLAEARLTTSDSDADAALYDLISEAIELRHDQVGADSWQAAEAERIRGLWLAHAARRDEAAETYKHVIETIDALPESADPRPQQTRRRAAEALAALSEQRP